MLTTYQKLLTVSRGAFLGLAVERLNSGKMDCYWLSEKATTISCAGGQDRLIGPQGYVLETSF